jgi:dihydrofolate synthase/folylpolyglutamate synthase
MVRLLDRLGNPQHRLPPVVHVAGTNGKGSLIAYLRAMLEAAGHSVHVYTSPHLVHFNERIRLGVHGGGNLIPEPDLATALEECERVNDCDPITFFEITTAAAFHVFAQAPADILLLETGLGGRLDATNVVDKPALVALTPISHDHHQYLGDDLGGISAEKAAIIKPGVPTVVGPQTTIPTEVIRARAAAVGAPLFRHGREWAVKSGDNQMVWCGEGETLELPLPALAGTHQIANAGTAIACLHLLKGFPMDPAPLAAGLRNVEWPARLQRLRRGPLVDLLPDDAELWLDGGHNPDAGQALAASISAGALGKTDRPLHLIAGMLNTKEPDGFLAPLAPLAASAQCIAIPGEQASFSAEDLAAGAARIGLEAHASAGLREAITAVMEASDATPPRILICGSLYLAGTVLAENG